MSGAERRGGTSAGIARPADGVRRRTVARAARLLALVGILVFTAFEASGAPGAAADVQRFVGRWVRPDGGYVLELLEVREDGGVEARYFNPRPIHVGRAEIRKTDDRVSVFVELRDVNYPGSAYALQYDAAADRLQGTYFQAVSKETFDIEFVRIR